MNLFTKKSGIKKFNRIVCLDVNSQGSDVTVVAVLMG